MLVGKQLAFCNKSTLQNLSTSLRNVPIQTIIRDLWIKLEILTSLSLYLVKKVTYDFLVNSKGHSVENLGFFFSPGRIKERKRQTKIINEKRCKEFVQ